LEEGEGTLFVDLAPEKLEETRRNIPVYGQRRFDVYPDVSEGKVRFED
jgi:omega-amidase